jgi:hypothetical protein
MSEEKRVHRHAPWSITTMVELYLEGHSLREVSRVTGYSYGSVNKYVKEAGMLRTRSQAQETYWERKKA